MLAAAGAIAMAAFVLFMHTMTPSIHTTLTEGDDQ
jgi:hypothetical protein